MLKLSSVLTIALTLFQTGVRAGPAPMADVHIHYKWSQEDVTRPDQAIAALDRHNVRLAVVIGTPAELALMLHKQAPERIRPIWSPYESSGDWSRWPYDRSVPKRARQALASGRYHGIGELHLVGGFAPDWRTPVIESLLQLAVEFDVPIMLHTEFSHHDYLLNLCRAHPRVRILWAHAGSILSPRAVDAVMSRCNNVWAELSARDTWRFVNHPITRDNGALLPEWQRLVRQYPDRFMIGSDPVWPVDNMDSWDEPDTGWEEYGRFIGFHRDWLRRLEPWLAEKVRLTNALEFFGVEEGRTTR